MRRLSWALLGLSLACGGGGGEQQDHATNAADTSGSEADDAPEAPARRLSDDEAAEARTQALSTHTLAGQAYARCSESHEMRDCVRAQGLYGVAADTWGALLRGRAGDSDVPEWRFMHAQALFRADHFAEAADAFEQHLDEGLPSEWQTAALGMWVVACEHVLQQAIAREDLTRRTAPPAAAGQPPTVPALELPPAVTRLNVARARYVLHVPPEEDAQQHARQYALDRALSLYHYGQWEDAEPELSALFDAGCAGDAAWRGARQAWLALRQMALSRGQLDALASLGERLTSNACTFGEAAASCAEDAQRPACLAQTDAARIRQVGGERFMQRAQQTQGEERTRWATRAGEIYLASLASQPAPFARVEALAHAASAFELAGTTQRVAEVDAQLIALPLGDFEAGELEFAVQEVARALARRLEAAQIAGEMRTVVRVAPQLLREELASPDLSDERARARLLLAQAQASLGHHREASTAYLELSRATTNDEVRRDSALSAALEEKEARGCRRGRSGLGQFVTSYGGQAGARESVVRALWELASCERAGSEAYFDRLHELGEARTTTSGQMSVETRAHAAEAAFRLADRDFDEVTRLRLRLPRVDQVEEFAPQIQAMLEQPGADMGQLVRAYEAVEPLGSREWSVAAATRGAAAVDALMNAITHAQWALPTSVQRALPRLSRTASQQIREGTEARILELLEQQAERLRCSAAARYAHAAELAGSDLHTDSADAARAGFTAIDVDVLARCRQRNPSLFN